MLGILVEYSGDIKLKVEAFESMDSVNKIGGYWNDLDDKELAKVKGHIKNHYIKAQDFTCPYCKQRIEIKHNAVWDIEHIIPKDTYPDFMFSPLNLCIACKDCNLAKRNKNILINPTRKTLPTKSTDYLIIHPHLDDYSKHMKTLKSSLFFIPLDSKGKETIETCGLLRFLYKFTDYGNISVGVKKKIGSLQNELMEAETAVEEHFILSCLADVVKHGKKLAKKELLKKTSN